MSEGNGTKFSKGNAVTPESPTHTCCFSLVRRLQKDIHWYTKIHTGSDSFPEAGGGGKIERKKKKQKPPQDWR